MLVRDYARIQLQGHLHMSVCGRAKGNAFTLRNLSPEKKEETSQLDYIIGPMRRNGEVYIHNDVRTWSTWDHNPTMR